eukprot:3971481-Prorocentrum_lima.AAC.1
MPQGKSRPCRVAKPQELTFNRSTMASEMPVTHQPQHYHLLQGQSTKQAKPIYPGACLNLLASTSRSM